MPEKPRYVVAGPMSSSDGGSWCVIDTRGKPAKPISWWIGGRHGADEEAARLNAKEEASSK